MSIWVVALVSGFSIGIVGNIHCLAMCGPLALALPTQHFSNTHKIISIIYYNFGRVISYSLLGLVFGLIGNSISLLGLQQALSIVSGLVLLLLVFTNFLQKNKAHFLQAFKIYVQNHLISAMQHSHKIHRFLLIGFLNGLLPCGLVYIAITTALSMGNVLYAVMVMFSFGIGTLPLMLALMLFKNSFHYKLNVTAKKVVPVFVSIMACLLILRGLNLNIPYISPHFSEKTTAVGCH